MIIATRSAVRQLATPKRPARVYPGGLVLHVESLRNNHTSVGMGRLFDRGGDDAADTPTPTNSERGLEVTTEKPADESAAILVPSGFKLTPGTGWTVETIESSTGEEPGSASWSVAIATQDEDKSQRLGVFISFDIGHLLNRREWQMTLEQEMAKVRHRVRQLLTARRKAGSGELHSA